MKHTPLRLFDFLSADREGANITLDASVVPFAVSEKAVWCAVETFKGVSLSDVLSLVELPYPSTWFEYVIADTRFAAWARQGGDLIHFTCFLNSTPQDPFGWKAWSYALDKKTGGVLAVGPGSEMHIITKDSDKGPEWVGQICAIVALMNSEDLSVREAVDMSKVDLQRKRKSQPRVRSYTYIKLTPDAEEWVNYARTGQTTYQDGLGQHWVRRHPHRFWFGKRNGERTLKAKMIGPFKRGNPEKGEIDPGYIAT